MPALGLGISPVFGGFSAPYIQKILGTEPADLLALWAMNESSGVTAVAQPDTSYNGTYSGVTLNSTTGPDGNPAPLWDGINDHCNVYSAALATNFDGQELTHIIWAKVSGAGVWSDATVRYLRGHRVNTSNLTFVAKDAVANRLVFRYKAGGTTKQVLLDAVSTTGWFCAGLTASLSGDALKAYFNGSQTGATQTGLGTWAGSLAGDWNNIGAGDHTPLSNLWDGNLALAALWSKPLSADQMAALGTI